MTLITPRKWITSSDSSRLHEIRKLSRHFSSKKYSKTLIEGPQALYEALKYYPHALMAIYVSEPAFKRYHHICALYQGNQLFGVDEHLLKASSPQCQGICALFDYSVLDEYSPDFLFSLLKKNHSPLIILPHIQDPSNVATIIRLADAAGACGVVTCRQSVDIRSPKVIRMSVGSIFHLPVVAAQTTMKEIALHAHRSGILLLGADAHTSIGLFDKNLSFFFTCACLGIW